VELGQKYGLRREQGLIFSDERRGRGAGQCVLDDLIILARAQERADGRALVWLLHVAIESFDVETELPEIAPD
jgi:hypothetical protein